MKHVCAWCGKLLSEDTEEPLDVVSHGICQKCSNKELNLIPRPDKRGNSCQQKRQQLGRSYRAS